MADVQVTCITKPHPQSPHEHITHVGNPSAGWNWPREQVVASIEAKTNTFFVRDPKSGKRADIGVVRAAGHAPFLLNQTWTYLVTLKALPFLFERHPAAGGFQLNLGTASGTDIESVVPKLVAAEAFAAVHPSNNRKLTKDLKKLALECADAQSRYVFFGAPGFRHERQHKLETVEGIEVWGIDV